MDSNPLTQPPGSEGSRAGTPLGEGGEGLCRQGSRAELRPVLEEEGNGVGGLESPPPDMAGAVGGQVGAAC